MTTKTAKTPQDRRPPLARVHTRTTEAKRDDGLDEGLAFTDPADGVRLQVTLRNVKGKHDAALVAATGYDFTGLMNALNQRQGMDLIAAAVWFVRLVNGRESLTYAETLDEIGFEELAGMDLDEAVKDESRPEV